MTPVLVIFLICALLAHFDHILSVINTIRLSKVSTDTTFNYAVPNDLYLENSSEESTTVEMVQTKLNDPLVNRKLCRLSEHVNGTWKFSNNSSLKRFFCCSWDDVKYNSFACPEKSERCSTIRRSDNSKVGMQAGWNSCACDSRFNPLEKSPREMYTWEPNNCNLLAWNAKLFCTLLRNRTILMVGDSTMMQSGATLINMIKYGEGGCASNVYLSPSSHLAWRDHQWLGYGDGCSGDMTLEEAFLLVKANITILSCGPHLNDVGDLDAILFKLLNLIKSYRELTNTTYVWKTQNPGHFQCDKYNAPTVGSTGYPIPANLDKYHWNALPDYDNYIRSDLSKARYGFKILDMSPLYYRADAHTGGGDCLHFCIPGPVDLFSILLLQMLNNGEV